MSKHLPPWMAIRDDGVVEVDPDGFYPFYLAQLGVKEPDQYTLEIAYQCMKLDCQVIACSVDAIDPRRTGTPTSIHVIGGDRATRWAQSTFPKGKGSKAATEPRKAGDPYGNDAREAYLKMRKGQHPLMGRRQDPVDPDDVMKPDALRIDE